MKIFRIPMLWNICVVSVEFALPGDNPKFCVNLRWDTQGRFLCVIRFVRFRTAIRLAVKFGEWKHPVFSTEGDCKRKRTVPSCVIKLTHQHLILSGRICNRLERQKRNTWLTKRDNHIVYKIWGRTFLLCRDIINDNVYMRTTGYAKTKML